jgi:DNA polymerase-4
MRRILHIDMDAFFAAVEQKRNPGLRGKPVVIGGDGDPRKRGVVSTASYEARPFGIHSAMPLRTAHRLCPQAVFLPVDMAAYAGMSNQIKGILSSLTPLIEDVGIDEAFLDISALDGEPGNIAAQIKARIANETGLTCSIGIAPNKLLAKIASDMIKPDGLTVIAPEDIGRRIWPLPVRKLWGIGPKTEAALKALGVESIGDLATLSLEVLTERFGRSYGTYLYQASRGIDDSPLITSWEPKSMSREVTFQKDLRDWQSVARNLADLARAVAADLRDGGCAARTFTLKIRFSDFETLTRAKTLAGATDNPEEIRRAAFACLKRIELRKMVRLIGLRASNLLRDGSSAR